MSGMYEVRGVREMYELCVVSGMYEVWHVRSNHKREKGE